MKTSRYARLERERRFSIVAPFPLDPEARQIEDRYITGTRLRLRRVTVLKGEIWKLATIDPAGSGERWITNLYLEPHEAALVAELPARVVRKMRHRVEFHGRMWAVDLFEDGDAIAETEVGTDEEIVVPPWCGEERHSSSVPVPANISAQKSHGTRNS